MGVKTRELIITKSSLEWFRTIMFFMDIRIRDVSPAATENFVVIRYVCGEKKQRKMLIASAGTFKTMRA